MHQPSKNFARIALAIVLDVSIVGTCALAGPPDPGGATPAPTTAGPAPSVAVPTAPTSNVPTQIKALGTMVPRARQHVVAHGPVVFPDSTVPSAREQSALAAAGLRPTSSEATGLVQKYARISYAAIVKQLGNRHFTVAERQIPSRPKIDPATVVAEARSKFASNVRARGPLGNPASGAASVSTALVGKTIPIVEGVYPNNKVGRDFAQNDTLTIAGKNFGSNPTVRLVLPNCGTYTLPLAYVSDDVIVAGAIPEILVNRMTMSAQLIVNAQNFDTDPATLTYHAPLDLVDIGFYLWMDPMQGYGDAHAPPGYGLVEGRTMFTSAGGSRYSCCTSTYGGHGGNGNDIFFKDVAMINDWRVVDSLIGDLGCGNLQTCDARFVSSPLGASSGIFQASGGWTGGALQPIDPNANIPAMLPPGGGSTNPYTEVAWGYNADNYIVYSVSWTFLGPRGKRATTVENRHGNVCED